MAQEMGPILAESMDQGLRLLSLDEMALAAIAIDSAENEAKKTTTDGPVPSLGCQYGETSVPYDMLIKRALIGQARKDGSSSQDLYHFIRKKCDAPEQFIKSKIESSLCRMFKNGFVYLNNKPYGRFKLTSKGKAMQYVEKKPKSRGNSVCRYPGRSRSRSKARTSSVATCKPKKKANVCKYSAAKRQGRSQSRGRAQSRGACRSKSRASSRSKSKSVCRYKPPKAKRPRSSSKSACRKPPQKKDDCKFPSKNRKRKVSGVRLVCGYPGKKN